MEGKPLVNTRGFQLSLVPNDEAPSLSDWQSGVRLNQELQAFEQLLRDSRGLAGNSAQVLARHLAAMVRQSGAGTASDFVQQPHDPLQHGLGPKRQRQLRRSHPAAASAAQNNRAASHVS